jgi:eukaryotic-like serine/threonine-protein kinase
VDCDDVAVLLAGEARTLSGREEARYHRHLAECATCRTLAAEATDDDAYRWVARVPEEALADPDLLVLPVVDPVVFNRGRTIAAGGMGQISIAHDRRLGRNVAIKEVLEPELRARFEREAMITARLQHPAIVPIYEAGTWPDGSAFYTMRLVSGGTLGDVIAAAKTLEDRLALLPHAIAATEALAYAHSMRIVHRDLKPGNVLVGEFGETVVIDWGLAREIDRQDGDRDAPRHTPSRGDLTQVGAVMGTPCFMSPEQAAGENVDARTDVYALGAILYNLLAGAPPYFDESIKDDVEKLVEAGLERPPTPIGKRAPDAPADLRAIVERAMARPADARYPSAREMAEELRRFEAGQLIARKYTLPELLGRWLRRHRTAVVVGLIAIVALGAVATAAVVNLAASRAAERAARRAAESAQRESDATLGALLEANGRDALAAGDRDRALAHLAKAYVRGRDTVGLRHMLPNAAREVVLRQHSLDAGGAIDALGFQADGRVVTVEAIAPRVRVWDGDTAATTYRIDGRGSGVTAIAPGARRVALGLIDEPNALAMVDVGASAVLWNAVDPIYGRVFELVFDPTGAMLMSYAFGLDPQIRDVETGRLIATLPRGRDDVVDAAFSADGRRVAIATAHAVRVFDTRGYRPVGSLALAGQTVTRIALATGDRIVIGGANGQVTAWTIGEAGSRALPPHPERVAAIAAAPGGETFATADRSGVVRLWSLDGHLLAEAHDHQGAVYALAYSPDGRVVLGAGPSTRVHLWDASTLALRRSIDAFGETLASVAWSPDGARFATAGMREEEYEPATVWATPAGALIARVATRTSAVAGATLVTAEGPDLVLRDAHSGAEHVRIADATVDLLALDAAATTVLVWGKGTGAIFDFASAMRSATYSRPAPATGAPLPPRLSADGRRVLEISDLYDDKARIVVVDTATGMAVTELAVADIEGGDISPRGDRIVLTSSVARPALYGVPGGQALPGLAGIPQRDRFKNPRLARFVRSGERIVAFGIQAPMVIDATTGAVVASLVRPGLEQTVDAIAADDGGRVVATWSSDGAAALWNADTGAVHVVVPDVAAGSIAVTRDGARFATGGVNGTIRIFDAAGFLLDQIRAHRRAVVALSWTDSGTRLIARGDDGFTTIWDVHLETRSPDAIAKLAAEQAARAAIPPGR